MPWIPMLAGAAIGAIQGDANRRSQQKANEQQADISAAQTRFSPWTHLGTSTPQLGAIKDSGFGGAVQGGLGGAMFGKQFGFGMKKPIGEEIDETVQSGPRRSMAGEPGFDPTKLIG